VVTITLVGITGFSQIRRMNGGWSEAGKFALN
jgi:hypothetical protein